MRISDWSSDVCSSDLPVAMMECLNGCPPSMAGLHEMAIDRRPDVIGGRNHDPVTGQTLRLREQTRRCKAPDRRNPPGPPPPSCAPDMQDPQASLRNRHSSAIARSWPLGRHRSEEHTSELKS